jgi:hypothetical protein
MAVNLYSRSFRRDEAEILLATAGIRHHGVERTYLADRTVLCDDVGKGPAEAQAVVAILSARANAGGRQVSVQIPVHMYFVWNAKMNRWDLYKVAIEKSC